MNRRTKAIGAAAVTLLVLGGGAGIALATADDGAPPSGPVFEKAKTTAVDSVGGGHVTKAEANDSGGFEVEVTRPDGTRIDVDLDRNSVVVSKETEPESVAGANNADEADQADETDEADETDQADETDEANEANEANEPATSGQPQPR